MSDPDPSAPNVPTNRVPGAAINIGGAAAAGAEDDDGDGNGSGDQEPAVCSSSSVGVAATATSNHGVGDEGRQRRETRKMKSDSPKRSRPPASEASSPLGHAAMWWESFRELSRHPLDDVGQSSLPHPQSPLPLLTSSGGQSQTIEATQIGDRARSDISPSPSPPPPPPVGRVPSTPGAYRVRPAAAGSRRATARTRGGYDYGDDADYDDDDYGSASPDVGILWVEASLAEDDDADAEARRQPREAQPPCGALVVAEATPVLPRRRRRQITLAGLAIVAAIATAVGVASGLLLANRSSLSANSAAVAPPTTAATSELGETFLHSLPPSTRQSLRNESSPQSRAFAWATRKDTFPRMPDQGADVDEERGRFRMLQRFVLATLYYATSGETTWIERQHWLDPETSECDWRGCCCGPRCKVFEGDSSPHDFFGNESFEVVLSGLFLSGNGLAGRLPAELGLLTQLQRLDANRNSILGPIPAQLGDVTGLITLRLSDNLLTGAIPTQLGLLKDLVDLRFRGANSKASLTASIPSELGLLSGLTALDLGGNHLNSTLPTELGRLTKLSELWLDNNQLSGPVPSQLGLLSNVEQLWLGNNSLVGTLPSELLNLPVLRVLSVENNHLASTLPTQLGGLSTLEELLLSGNALTGPLPNEIGLLTALRRLSLLSNRLTSTLPTHVGQLTRLEFLVARNNSLTGSIPHAIGNLAALVSLDVGMNRLNATIPSTLGELSSLRELLLENNDFSGSLPSELGRLSSLDPEYAVRLGGNRLTGTVPGELCQLLTRASVRLIVECQDVACTCNCTCAESVDDDAFYAPKG